MISVSIANYAVSASYLGRETRLIRIRMENREQELDEKIKELQTKGLSIEELKKETKKEENSIPLRSIETIG
jgi:S-adenosylhomocysteine hydrolase